MYKLVQDPTTQQEIGVRVQLEHGEMFIPFHESNTDYQQYLKWLEEGNTPEPAEEQQ